VRAPGAAVTSVRVRSAGRHAIAARRGRAPARVIAAFERSCYIETEAGLACLGTHALGNGPLNALCDTLPRTAPGDLLLVDLAAAVLWQPAALPPWRAADMRAALARLSKAAARSAPLEGFAFLLAPGAREDAPLLSHAGAAAALAAWIAAAARAECADSSEPSAPLPPVPPGTAALVGLGPGLTPAGDDLLGGALAALHAAGRAGIAGTLAAWVLPLAQHGTSRISRAHLACAARGETGEAVHGMLGALLAGGADLEDPLARVAAVGHTSGWDALAGAALAFTALDAPGKV
jgi:hypothetical protein